MKRLIALLFLGVASAAFAAEEGPFLSPVQASSDTAAAPVYWLEVKGAIDPATARYVDDGLAQAAADGAQMAVIVLDTPGGLLDATRDVVQSILNAPVPVVVYVEPRGARATSAGFFITMAADVAAMAPGTHLGAAHPVLMAGKTGGGPVMEAKVLSDATAYARALAEDKGRDADWAAKAVSESASLTSEEALSKKVIDIVAQDEDDLSAQLQGGTLDKAGRTFTLLPDGAPDVDWDMSWPQKFLHALGNPNLAYVLLVVGIYALLFQLAAPGHVLGGVAGVLCLALAFFSLQGLPLNVAGLALLAAGLFMMAADHALGGHGFLMTGGALAFGTGSFMLYDGVDPVFRVSPPLIVGVLAAALLFSWIVLKGAWAVRGLKPLTGREALEGKVGVVRPGGLVFLDGQLWTADGYGPFQPGEKVRVIGVEGNTLKVEKF